jgi:Tfp pilus assembly protein PilZ
MLYYIVILMIFAVLAFAVVVLFRKITIIQKRRTEWRLKESEFMNKLVSEGDPKPDQIPGLHDNAKAHNINDELDGNQIRTLIFQEINHMPDEEIQQFYQEVKEKHIGKSRKHDRKDFYLIVDYKVNDQYYRDVIQDISETGVFINTPQTFSVNQQIRMTFMSPDYQKPFNVKGEIVRVHTDGIGVKFMMESQVQKEALKTFMGNLQKHTNGTQQ